MIATDAEVIVVGAGLSGLAAAHELAGLRVLVLEAGERAGGRVLTVAMDGVPVDLGACFAFAPGVLPDGAAMAQPVVRERGPIGLFAGGRLVFGDTTAACLAQAGRTPDPALLDAFFCQIHAGDRADYSRERQADALKTWHPDHWPTGNGAAVEAYLARVPVRLGCRVERVRDGVALLEDGTALRAGAVIVATPATVAREIIEAPSPAAAELLGSVRYARYTVGAFVLDEPPRFRCVVTPELSFSCVVRQGRALLCYVRDRAAARLDALSDDDALSAMRADLARLGVSPRGGRLMRWPLAGTILSNGYAVRKQPEATRAAPGVFLAGDYAAPGWGYGMADAVAAGRRAAREARAALRRRP